MSDKMSNIIYRCDINYNYNLLQYRKQVKK